MNGRSRGVALRGPLKKRPPQGDGVGFVGVSLNETKVP
ncbi:hypothetical protein ABIA96_003471 [Bradyrhizobium sp. LB11.1]